MTNLGLRFAARSEIGKVRRNNEDAGYAATDLLVVADGMGGHEAGELASAATVAAVVAAASNSVGADEVLNQLAEAVITSGEYIADVVSGDRDLAGMGTTMTVVALREDRIAMAHVGDSRAYVYRDGALQQMTKDHTFVQTLVDSGEITLEQAAVHPRRNLMMRAIDGIHAVEVDLSVRETREGDRYLLCSDGLCGVIDANTISECLSQEDLTQAVTLLIDAAIAPALLPVLIADLRLLGCDFRADAAARAIVPDLKPATDEDFATEWLDAILSVKVVSGVAEALTHIRRFGSEHTEAIITEDAAAAQQFLDGIASAVGLWNASTHFCDGGEFGFGAEIGIATGRLHARGPVGLEQLCTYRYKIFGTGQVRP